jgi:hypothetical protein
MGVNNDRVSMNNLSVPFLRHKNKTPFPAGRQEAVYY